MYFRQTRVYPSDAEAMLQTMGENRRLNERRVQMLAEDIGHGRWHLSPQPICFDEDGKLIDGQHRLTAIIRSGIPVDLIIAYNVPHGCVLDKGLERSSGEALYMRSLISKDMSSREVWGVVNRYLEIKYGASKAKAMSDTAKSEFIRINEQNISKAISLSRKGAHRALCKKAGIQTAVFAALSKGIPENILLSFTTVVNTGFMDQVDQSAAIVLRNYALQAPSSGSTEANNLCIVAEMAIRDFVNGVPRKKRYTPDKHIYIDKE